MEVIIILGPPGSGKGTQARLLARELDLYHLETSEIIKRKLADAKKEDFVVVKNKKYFLLQEKKIRETGGLMSPPLIAFWVKNRIRKIVKEGKGIVTSGSPRTLYEGKELIPFFEKLYGAKNIRVILINLSEKESIWRNSHRRICKLMHHPILYTKETANLTKCPLDGSKLSIRKDDTIKTIKLRFGKYKEKTFPLVDYFKKRGLELKEVNGEQAVADVFEEILRKLEVQKTPFSFRRKTASK